MSCLAGGMLLSQTIPPDSLFLGQTPPGYTPVIFELPVTAGLRPIERIALSNDGTELYFGQLNTYPPTAMKINYFKYQSNSWQGPFFLFDGYLGPALSPNDSLLFMQEMVGSTFAVSRYSVRTGTGWSTPEVLFPFNQQSHYSQLTSLNTYYTSSVFPGNSAMDVARVITGTDTSLVSLGPPICTNVNEGDFFIARDESFMIHARSSSSTPGDLLISYKKSDGTWTNSKSLGNQINTSIWEYGPFVTADNKYLFFTRGGNLMSSYYTYWVRVDALIDSLRFTNYAPYVKNPIPDQTAYVGQLFTYAIPDSTFLDDDGNNTLSFHAVLTTGQPLPEWLVFDSVSCTLTGTPVAAGNLYVKITATDTAGAGASAILKMSIQLADAVENNVDCGLLIFPNPTNSYFTVKIDPRVGECATMEIFDLCGRQLFMGTFRNTTSVDWSGKPAGVYFLHIKSGDKTIIRKLIRE
jgi:hypothetical protein